MDGATPFADMRRFLRVARWLYKVRARNGLRRIWSLRRNLMVGAPKTTLYDPTYRYLMKWLLPLLMIMAESESSDNMRFLQRVPFPFVSIVRGCQLLTNNAHVKVVETIQSMAGMLKCPASSHHQDRLAEAGAMGLQRQRCASGKGQAIGGP